MRTTIELIEALDAVAGGFDEVALAVAWTDHSGYVMASNEKRQEVLDSFVKDGGNPVGFVAFQLYPNNNDLATVTRPLKEYAGEAWAEDFLTKVCEELKGTITKEGKGRRIQQSQ